MAFDRILQTNRLEMPRVSLREWWLIGPPYSSYPLTAVLVSSNLRNIGDSRVTLCNKTGPWHPGKFAVNPIDARRIVASCTGGYLPVRGKIGNTWYMAREVSGNIAGLYASLPADLVSSAVLDAHVKDLALQQAYSKAVKPDADLGLMLVELNETLNLLVSPVTFLKKKLARLASKPPPGKAKFYPKGKTPLSYIGEKWLELRYGILPLMSDIEDIRHLVNRKMNFDSHIFSKGRRLSSLSTSTSSKTTANAFGGTVQIEISTVQQDYVSARIYFRPVNHVLSHLTDTGLSPNRIAHLVWEKIPFSFVVDWIYDFGNWLDAITPHPTIEQISTSVSVHSSLRRVTRVVGFQSNYEYVSVNSVHTSDTDKFLRIIGSPVPTIPLVNNEILNVVRSIDSLALAWGNLPRALKPFKGF